jgi:hypothetical protein
MTLKMPLQSATFVDNGGTIITVDENNGLCWTFLTHQP